MILKTLPLKNHLLILLVCQENPNIIEHILLGLKVDPYLWAMKKKMRMRNYQCSMHLFKLHKTMYSSLGMTFNSLYQKLKMNLNNKTIEAK